MDSVTTPPGLRARTRAEDAGPALGEAQAKAIARQARREEPITPL